ncbi:MAG: ParB N-terminal domain-containing protein [Campylobacter sp.]|nr:ParB N-terminal domain-containing protein [Campylobacter sp.]
MLQDASIIELMLTIAQNGYFIGEPLLVTKDNEKYIVIEGNRRLTALKLLQKPNLADVYTKKIEQVLKEGDNRPTNIPCIVFESRNEILQYLGYRHVTGVKSRGMLEKARYLNYLLPTMQNQDINSQSGELAKKIGSKSDYIKRVLVSYQIYEIIKDSGFYKIPKLDETTIYFNYFADSLRYENIILFWELT